MEDNRRLKLLKYLFPTNIAINFLCNDLFLQLTKIISKELCISTKNLKNNVRLENKNKVEFLINNFLQENNSYLTAIMNFYKAEDYNNVLQHILTGFVFYLTFSIPKFAKVDIFRDKKSICYSPISILDFMQ